MAVLLEVGVPPNRGCPPHQVRARQMVPLGVVIMRKPGVLATGRQIQAVAATTMTGIASTQVLRGIRATEVVGMLEVPSITVL